MIKLPDDYNYIAAFLTYKCNLHCSYCITKFNSEPLAEPMSASKWIVALNRIEATNKLPITLQGGEPTQHPEFYEIVNGVNKPMDLLTNLQFDVEEFMKNVGPSVFFRKAPYAAIRVSYHPMQMSIQNTFQKVLNLHMNDYQVGIYMVDHPKYQSELQSMKFACAQMGLDFRTKELLSDTSGTFKYKGAVGKEVTSRCFCKPSELLIAPDGQVYLCHSHLYNSRSPWDHIFSDNFTPVSEHLPCYFYGTCNPCDIKVTNNRFQEHGHTSVDINHVEEITYEH